MLRQRYPAAYCTHTLLKVQAWSPEQPARIYKASWARDTSDFYFAHLLFLFFVLFVLVLRLTSLTWNVALGIFRLIFGYEPEQIYNLDRYTS